MSKLPRRRGVCGIAGAAMTVRASKSTNRSPTTLIREVLNDALSEAGMEGGDIDGFVCVPSLCDLRFLEAHYQATALGLFEKNRHLLCRTVDTCGASPVTSLLEASRMIECEGLETVAVVAGDCVGSLSGRDFLAKADRTAEGGNLQSPAIVNGYERYTEYELETRRKVTRDHLRLLVVLESYHASLHSGSMLSQKGIEPYSLEEMRSADSVTPNISIKECAWRSDGAGCVIVTKNRETRVKILGGAEASSPLYPPSIIDDDCLSSSSRAMRDAYARTGLSSRDIDFFALYDCFPICFSRAIEASGLAGDDPAGYLEAQHDRLLRGDTRDNAFFPCNTHGGLLCYGAPFAVPAIFNIVEAYRQLTLSSRGRQLDDPRRSLVYGNGGILSSSAVAILEKA